jgi:DNA-binding IclR family transcriptional regulator
VTEVLSHDLGTVLGKTVAVLRAFRLDDRGLSLAEMARRTGLPKATLHRLLAQMVQYGLLDRSGSVYSLGRLVFELGVRASGERDLLEVAGPFLEDLRAEVRETVHLGVREGTSVFYVAKLAGRSQAIAPSRPGGRLGLHCTAVGKALLAHAGSDVFAEVVAAGLERRTPRTVTAPGVLARQLREVRRTSTAFETEESRTGLVCVAAPVLAPDGEAVAAVSIAGPVHRFDPRKHAATVRATAQAFASVLARSRPE